MKYRLAHVVEYAAVRALSGILAVLPHRAALGLVWVPARLVFACNRKLRNRTCRRLRLVFGSERSRRDISRMAWRAFRNLVFMAVESLKLPSLRTDWVARHMDPGPVAIVREELAKGRGLIVALPHLGNWELAGIALQSQGVDLVILVRKQKNPLMNAWINRIRTQTGVESIDTHSRQIGEVARRLNEANKVLTILPDVRAKTGGVRVRYLGVETDIPLGTVHYAREAGLPILTAEVVRSGWTRHAWRVTGRIEPDLNLDEAADGRRIMQYIMDRFSESVRAHPEDYFWFNKRWVLGAEEAP